MNYTRMQWRAAQSSRRPATPAARGKCAPGLEPRTWIFDVPGLGQRIVEGCRTKSEARAVLKRQLKRSGLPAGTAGRLATAAPAEVAA